MSINSYSDAILVERAQKGDPSSMDTLISKHQSRAYKYAFRLTRNTEMAADVVAKTFLRVYRGIHTFKGACSFTTWLYRIVTNCYLDLKKIEAQKGALSLESFGADEEGDNYALDIPDDSPSAFDQILKTEKNQAMFEALAEIPEYQQAILTMFHVELLSYEEIAEALEIPMGTVKSRISRARLRLSGVFQEHRSLFDEHLASEELIAA